MTKEFLRTEAEVVPDLLVLNFIVDFGLFMRFVNINDNKKHLTKQDGAHCLLPLSSVGYILAYCSLSQ